MIFIAKYMLSIARNHDFIACDFKIRTLFPSLELTLLVEPYKEGKS